MFLVDNVDEVIEWYKEIFDAKINATDPENPPYEWVSLLIGDVEIMFAKMESAVKWYSENVVINKREDKDNNGARLSMVWNKRSL